MKDTGIGTAAAITLNINRRKKEISIEPDELKVEGGQKVVWKRTGDKEPFIISFEKYKNKGKGGHESPFPEDTFTDDTALTPQVTLWGGTFRYSVTLINDPSVSVDPVVVVVPPTYPPQ